MPLEFTSFLCVYRIYAVIVVTGTLLRGDNAPRGRRQTRSPSDIIADMNNELSPPYMDGADIYTAAVWTNPHDVPDVLVVGAGSSTTGPDGRRYVNEPLSEGTEYGVFYYIRLKSDVPVSWPLLDRDLNIDLYTICSVEI